MTNKNSSKLAGSATIYGLCVYNQIVVPNAATNASEQIVLAAAIYNYRHATINTIQL